MFELNQFSRKTIQNTPFQHYTIFSNTEMLWDGFLFLFIFFSQYVFFQLKNSSFCVLNILSLITASSEMWLPKIWIRCWDWWLLNGHLHTWFHVSIYSLNQFLPPFDKNHRLLCPPSYCCLMTSAGGNFTFCPIGKVCWITTHWS